MRRRPLLAAIGASATALSSGCLGTVADRLDTSVQLGWFAAHNFDGETHRFELRVERGDTEVHQSSHEVAPRDGVIIHSAVAECTWGDAAGAYTVAARVDDTEWIEESLNEVDAVSDEEVDCGIAEAEYRNGSLSVQCRSGCDQGYNGTCQFTDR